LSVADVLATRRTRLWWKERN